VIATAVMLAMAELWRSRARTVLAAGTVAVLAFLTLTLTGLADALDRGSTGVLQAVDADVVVFNEEARRQLLRSRVPHGQATSLLRVDGVRAVGTIALVPTSAETPAGRTRVTLVGYHARTPAEPDRLVEGRLPVDGEPGIAAVDTSLRRHGVALGDEITLAGDRVVEVVGFVENARFLQQPTVWVPPDLWAQVRMRAFPETGWAESLAGVSLLRLSAGADPAAVAAAVQAEVDGLEAVPMDDAVRAIPGVDVQRGTFGTIVALTVAVTAVVVALLFVLIVTERRAQLAALRALGAPPRLLIVALLSQATVLWLLALVTGTVGTAGLSLVAPAAMPLALRQAVVVTAGAALLLAALAGAGFALRRVHRLDPAIAMEDDQP
jgi:hypothetical protein